jgi:demethoxyubiquinone hydroxylase (CLK1/Coq7/Cat5 family)
VVGETNTLAYAMEMQAKIWYWQDRLEDARSEILGAKEVYEGLGLSKQVEYCRVHLREMEEAQVCEETSPDGQFLERSSAPGCIDLLFSLSG